jgi:hypothetical protein
VEALGALPLFLRTPLHRGRHLRWGATDAEVAARMPGDELVPRASFDATRAITIMAPPRLVWPWIVQAGYRRAGFYSYALLDNAGYESPATVLEEYQDPQVGDWMPMAAKVSETTAFRFTGFDTGSWLLWSKPDSTWSWVLRELPGGGTRLVTRLKQRYQWESPVVAVFTALLLELGDFPMMRRMLIGIRERAEHLASEGGDDVT